MGKLGGRLRLQPENPARVRTARRRRGRVIAERKRPNKEEGPAIHFPRMIVRIEFPFPVKSQFLQ